MSKKNRKRVVSIVLLIVVIFASLKGYEWWVSYCMSKTLMSQLQELGDSGSEVIELDNIWGAEKLVACRGYLMTSDKLQKKLLEAGFAENVATWIAESPRWTEGTHFYLVKKKKVLSFYHTNHLLYMEHLGKDFIYANVGKKIYLDVTPDHDNKLDGIR